MTFAVISQTPTPSSTVARTRVLSFGLEFDTGILADVVVEALFASGTVENVYRLGAFGPQYSGSVSQDGDLYGFTVERLGGWHETVTLQVRRDTITVSLTLELADIALESDFEFDPPL